MPKYISPKITSKKIKLSFFLSNVMWLDQFNLVGNVYAQSGGGTAASNSGGFGGCGGACGCGTQGTGLPTGGASVSVNSSCNSACSSASGVSVENTVPSIGGYVPTEITTNNNCNSNSNCVGCSSGNDANGGSGGHS